MISHFSQEPFEGTLHIEDADLQKMAKVLNDVNIKECPYFDLSDKYGNFARYYRENQWIPCSERLPEEGVEILGTDDHGCIRHVVKDKCRLYEFATYEEMMHINIVAWQPLPEPYEG